MSQLRQRFRGRKGAKKRGVKPFPGGISSMQIWNSRAHAGVLQLLIILGPVAVVAVVPAMATATAGSITQVPAAAGVAAAPDCRAERGGGPEGRVRDGGRPD